MTTGRRSSWRLMRLSRSRPEPPGIWTSQSTGSGGLRSSARSASATSDAVRTSYPQSAILSDSTSRSAGSSSTTRTAKGGVSILKGNVTRRPPSEKRADAVLRSDPEWAEGDDSVSTDRYSTSPSVVGDEERKVESAADDDQEAGVLPEPLGLLDAQRAGDLSVLLGLRLGVRHVLPREDLILTSRELDGALRQAVDLREGRRVELTGRKHLAA